MWDRGEFASLHSLPERGRCINSWVKNGQDLFYIELAWDWQQIALILKHLETMITLKLKTTLSLRWAARNLERSECQIKTGKATKTDTRRLPKFHSRVQNNAQRSRGHAMPKPSAVPSRAFGVVGTCSMKSSSHSSVWGISSRRRHEGNTNPKRRCILWRMCACACITYNKYYVCKIFWFIYIGSYWYIYDVKVYMYCMYLTSPYSIYICV